MENIAAWIPAKGEKLEIRPSPVPVPGENELLIESRAVPIQPADWKIQAGVLPVPLTYPAILGTHVVGIVRGVGSKVTRFKEGDRVLSITAFMIRDDSRFGSWQRYCLSTQELTSHIYDTPFEEASSANNIYVSISAFVLHLGLDRPSKDAKPKNEKILIWGGASSVGSYGIQAAAKAGYEVITTSSPANIPLLKRLGASHVIDYKSPTAYNELLELGPYRAIWSAQDSAADQTTMAKLLQAQGGGKFLATMGPRPGAAFPEGTGAWFVQYLDDYLKEENRELTKWLFEDYIEGGLREGTFELGNVEVVGGLGDIQSALNRLREGNVSAKKLIIQPWEE